MGNKLFGDRGNAMRAAHEERFQARCIFDDGVQRHPPLVVGNLDLQVRSVVNERHFSQDARKITSERQGDWLSLYEDDIRTFHERAANGRGQTEAQIAEDSLQGLPARRRIQGDTMDGYAVDHLSHYGFTAISGENSAVWVVRQRCYNLYFAASSQQLLRKGPESNLGSARFRRIVLAKNEPAPEWRGTKPPRCGGRYLDLLGRWTLARRNCHLLALQDRFVNANESF